MPNDVFVDPDIEGEIEGVGEIAGEYPYRAFELLEFYKIIKEKVNIVSVSFDSESHIISFHFDEKEV